MGNTIKTGNTIEIYTPEFNTKSELKRPKRFIDIYDNVLGYVDKDVESLLRLL